MKTDQGGASWPFCPGCCRSLKASLISWLKLELLVAGFGRREATTSTSFCLPQICSPLPAMQLDWWLVPGTGEASQDQGCPAGVWSRDTTRDVHVGDPSPLLPALLRWSGARAAPLAGGKRTLNLMKLQGVGFARQCHPLRCQLPSRPRGHGPCPGGCYLGRWVGHSAGLAQKQQQQPPSCFQFPTSWQSRREKHVTDTLLLNSMGLKIKVLKFCPAGQKTSAPAMTQSGEKHRDFQHL